MIAPCPDCDERAPGRAGVMLHLTVNTGHARQSPRAEVRDDVIERLRPMVRAGGGDVAMPRVTPWLGVILHDLSRPEDLPWLGDFERCLGWALIEEAGA